ncbi:golgin subfamily A member 6-like protein 7 [Saccostrea echinata]|uniref:golgin subfamily A member 6-like protein 7 n=1 Tax=Saccostrea echinata TaxID=191078 RepID=UPI002A832FC0|nr:golgin subfamily A member 6-like protein 7 [Saccostrea echinata]
MQRILELERAEEELQEMKTKAYEEEVFREDEIEKLKKEVQSLNDTLSQERNIGEGRLTEMQKMEEDLHSHERTEESLQQRLEEANGEMDNLKRQIEKQCDENGRLIQRIRDLERAEEELREMKTKAYEEEVFRENEIEKLKKEVQSLNDTLSQERNIGEGSLTEMQKMEEDLHSHERTEESLQLRLEEANGEMDNLKRQIEKQCEYTSHERVIRDLNNEVYLQQDENGRLMQRILDLERAEEELREMKTKAYEEEVFREDEIEKLKQEVQSLNDTLSQERNIGEERLTEMQKMKEDLLSHERTEESLQKRLEEANGEMDNLKRQTEKQCEKLDKKEHDLSVANEQHEGVISKKDEAILKLTGELEGKKIENKTFETELIRINRELEDIKKEKTQLDAHILQLSGEVNKRDTKILELNANIEMKEAEKTYANECMKKTVQSQQEMAYRISNLQRVEMEKSQAEQDK